MKSFEALVKVAKVENKYAREIFIKDYVNPMLYNAYGKDAPLHLLSKLIIQSYLIKAICKVLGINKIAEINKTQTEQINTIFNGLIKTN